MTNYLKSMKKNQELQTKLKEELMAPKERKDSIANDEQVLKNARALRRSELYLFRLNLEHLALQTVFTQNILDTIPPDQTYPRIQLSSFYV